MMQIAICMSAKEPDCARAARCFARISLYTILNVPLLADVQHNLQFARAC